MTGQKPAAIVLPLSSLKFKTRTQERVLPDRAKEPGMVLWTLLLKPLVVDTWVLVRKVLTGGNPLPVSR